MMKGKTRREIDDITLDKKYEEILQLWDENKIDEAIKKTREIINQYPYEPMPYLWLGDLLFERSELEEALNAYKKAASLDENLSEAHSAQARMYYLLGNFKKADEQAEISLNINPENGMALYIKALILDREHNFELSDQYLKKANLIEPDNYPKPLNISAQQFEVMINDVIQRLPENTREFIKDIKIEIMDVPSDEDIEASMSPLSLSKMIYKKEEDRDTFKIVLFRRNIMHFSEDEDELSDRINICLLSELNKILNIIGGKVGDEKR